MNELTGKTNLAIHMSSVASIGDVCIILKITRYFRLLYLPFSDPKLRNAGDHVSKVSDLCWSFRPIIRNLILIKFLNLRKRRAKNLQEECLNPRALTT